MEQLERIREDIQANVGRRVYVHNNRGRSRNEENRGVVEHAFASVFTIMTEDADKPARVSYSYTDVLTRHLRITWL